MHQVQFRQPVTIWISAFLFILLATVPASWGFEPQDAPGQANDRTIREFRADLKTFMKLSKGDDPQLERNAIYNLCALHFEIVCDSRFETSQQLQGIRAVIGKRLATFSKDVIRAKLREDRRAARLDGAEGEALDSSSSIVFDSPGTTGTDSQSESQGDLAQSNTLGRIAGAGNDSSDSNAMYDSASESYYTLGALSGGPNQLFGYAGGRFAPPWDHGEDLVELITTVINPQFWMRNGGPGTIQYYRPSMVLVIRASQQGNEEVGDLLEKLRANAGTQLNIGGQGGAIGN